MIDLFLDLFWHSEFLWGTQFLWGVYPYFCITLFISVPLIRMVFRPFTWSTRATSMFNRDVIGWASIFFHWGIFLVFVTHIFGFLGGVLGYESWMDILYWVGLIGGLGLLFGAVVALVRRLVVPELQAMSVFEDYLVHLFIITIIGLSLYQVLFHGIFGSGYTASSWFASLWTLAPQPELLDSVSYISKLHILLSLTFLAYLPFTKLVHLWTLPLNFLVRPQVSMRTMRNKFQRRWEYALRSDKSFLMYALAAFVLFVIITSSLSGRPMRSGMEKVTAAPGQLAGYPLYVSQCARCHGHAGLGDGLGAESPRFASIPRDLTEGRYRFVSTSNGVASDQDLYHTLENGLVSAGMPQFASLSDQQLQSLVGVLDIFWKKRPEPGASFTMDKRPPSNQKTRALGKQLFISNCSTCHGKTGVGDGFLSEPKIIKDWKMNVVAPVNLAQDELKAGRKVEELYRRIAGGIAGGNISWLMPPFSRGLSNEQIWSLVDYLEWLYQEPAGATSEGPQKIIAGGLLAEMKTAQERGKVIFIQQACYLCHGPEGESGIENPNYVKGNFPALNTLAERSLNLYYPEDLTEALKVLNAGKGLDEAEDLNVDKAFLVKSKYEIIVETILKGRDETEVGKKDPNGVQPILMYARKEMLTKDDVRDLVAYFLSINKWEEMEEEETES